VTMSSHTVGMALGTYGGGLIYELTGSYYRFFLIQGGLELLAAACAFAIRMKHVRI
jgi:predicted MFS family arabinose efflux permease